jgi:FlaA1/EpsC-like NDP-sugar epimerase
MGEQLRVFDLAKDLIRLSGLDPASIPFQFTGIRPGEKLEEALWESDAAVEATSNPGILRVRERDSLLDLDVMAVLDDLVAAAEGGETEHLMMTLAVALPSFVGIPSTIRVESRSIP